MNYYQVVAQTPDLCVFLSWTYFRFLAGVNMRFAAAATLQTIQPYLTLTSNAKPPVTFTEREISKCAAAILERMLQHIPTVTRLQ